MPSRLVDVLVFGASGILGQYLVRESRERGFRTKGTHAGEPLAGLEPLDFTDLEAVRAFVQKKEPDVVFLAAAMTSVDACETNAERARLVNAEAPRVVAEASAASAAKLVHFSTDYVFDGTKAPAAEDRTPNPLNAYGRTKLEGERNILAAQGNALVLRTCVNFGWNRLRPKDNGVTWIVNRLRRGEVAPLFGDQFVSPSYTPHVARIAFDLLDKGATGIYHVASRDCVSRLEMGRAVCEAFGLPEGLLKETRIADANLPARRPLRSCLDVGKVERVLGTRMKTFREYVVEMRDTE